MANLKMTGFGKFILFLLIVAPIAYFGIQYLENNGTLDSLKEKVEDTAEARPAERAPESNSDILAEIDRKSNADSEQEAIIAEQQRKIEELKRQNEVLQKQKDESASTISIPPATSTPPPPPSTRNTSDAPSIDDLIRQAENKTGRTTTTRELTTPSVTKKSLATWTFTFANVSGDIEFYQQGDKLMSRTRYQQSNRVDTHELIKRNDRYYVRNSPTDEYYVVRSDGNLDAFDKDGFQTTCRRR